MLARAKSEAEIKVWLGWEKAQKQAQAPRKHFDFLRFGKPYSLAVLAMTILVTIFSVTKGFNWSVDFAGGTQIDISFAKPIEVQVVREAFTAAGVEDPQIQAIGDGNKQYTARFEGSNIAGSEGAVAAANSEAANSIRQALITKLADYAPDVQRVEYVGPAIGKELRKQGIYSVFWAVLGICIYVTLRFDGRFAPGALVKMVFDTFAVLAYYLILQKPFDLTAVAGVLTIVGYSVNDCIVIYDRIRENIGHFPRRTMYENINFALNETLARSINTSCATMISLFGILLFGTSQILNFATAMVVGIIAATLSSTFVATTALLYTEQWQKRKVIKVGTTN